MRGTHNPSYARQEDSVVAWLVPVALFWTLSAMYLGGASLRIEGGGAFQHLGGLLVTFAAYLVVYGILRAILSGVAGSVVGGVVFPIIVTSIALPFLTNLAFRLFGVSITAVSRGHEAA